MTKKIDNKGLCGQIAQHVIDDNYVDAEKALKQAVGSHVANRIANDMVDLRKQDLKR